MEDYTTNFTPEFLKQFIENTPQNLRDTIRYIGTSYKKVFVTIDSRPNTEWLEFFAHISNGLLGENVKVDWYYGTKDEVDNSVRSAIIVLSYSDAFKNEKQIAVPNTVRKCVDVDILENSSEIISIEDVILLLKHQTIVVDKEEQNNMVRLALEHPDTFVTKDYNHTFTIHSGKNLGWYTLEQLHKVFQKLGIEFFIQRGSTGTVDVWCHMKRQHYNSVKGGY